MKSSVVNWRPPTRPPAALRTSQAATVVTVSGPTRFILSEMRPGCTLQGRPLEPAPRTSCPAHLGSDKITSCTRHRVDQSDSSADRAMRPSELRVLLCIPAAFALLFPAAARGGEVQPSGEPPKGGRGRRPWAGRPEGAGGTRGEKQANARGCRGGNMARSAVALSSTLSLRSKPR